MSEHTDVQVAVQQVRAVLDVPEAPAFDVEAEGDGLRVETPPSCGFTQQLLDKLQQRGVVLESVYPTADNRLTARFGVTGESDE